MKELFNRLSVSNKLLVINVVVVVSALLLATGVFVSIERTAVRERIINELVSHTEIIAYNVAASLAFDDAGTATEILGSLQSIPQIQESLIFNAQGDIFAEYVSANVSSANDGYSEIKSGRLQWPGAHAPTVVFSNEGIFVHSEIELDEEVIGSIYIRSSLTQFDAYKARAMIIVGVVLGVTFLISLLILSKMLRLVSDPITHLSKAVTAVRKDKNYSVRVHKFADDELGHLTDSFNSMLKELGIRDAELNRHHLELEAEVEDRTSELQAANVSLEETVKALKQANRAIRISEENKKVAEESAHAKAQFLATMSHELRTPMNGVLGMLSLLSETGLTDDQEHYVGVAYESGNLLLELLNNVLDLSKIEQGKLVLEKIPFDVSDAIEDVFAIVGESAYSKGVELAYVFDDRLPTKVLGDPTRFKQLVFNIVGNAIKFTSKGYVKLSYSVIEETAGAIRIRFEVEDTGVGIRDDVREKIFETFSQADSTTTRKFGGTGLGLTLCRQLTRLMDGGIGVESEEGKGSTFWFDVQFDSVGASLSNQTFNGAQIKPMSLLVFDRNDTSTSALSAYFEHYYVGLDVVSDEEELHATLEKKIVAGRHYDGLIINLSVGLPEASKIALSEDVQCCLKPTQIILTGSLGDRNRAKEDKALANFQFLVKPLRRRYVRECVLMLQGRMESIDKTEVVVDATYAGAKKILVVEDNRINQQVAQGRLETMGFDVSLAGNGEEALVLLEKEMFDLVFMDCQMPVLDGFQATRRFREKEGAAMNRTPVVAMTAHVMAGDKEACMRAGMDDYIAKPFKTGEIKRVVDRWLRE
ncbi:hypothetical protein A9Q99_27110 [Gammaproteobacteria bacterium 45_16_T64]|nr:hypothetical protein A9Q99_27110 [Gammaproteobacteria bacterium 45_16_T64]